MIVAEIHPVHLGDWRGQLRDTETGEKLGEEWQAPQRGALIGKMQDWIPLSHLLFIDVAQ